MAATYMQPDNDLSHRNTIFAELDGLVVGMASGYTAEEHHHFSNQALMQAAGRRAPRAASFRWLFAALFRVLNAHDAGDFYLHYIGVDKDYRSRGIGSALLKAMEERARATGSNRFSLDVAAKNRGAIEVYERFGLSVISGWPRLPVVPKALLRMTKPIR
jgi:ribosomal protein S18 acetylase RimI-like enzyme